MASTDKKIRMTIVLENALYRLFHAKACEVGATHNGVIRLLIQKYLDGTCTCKRPKKG